MHRESLRSYCRIIQICDMKAYPQRGMKVYPLVDLTLDLGSTLRSTSQDTNTITF